jgi:alpha-2-macroglobulin
MNGLTRRLVMVLALLPLVGSAATAQDDVLRRLIVTQDADYAGHDYQTLRDVDQAACEAACLASLQCRAFTFNAQAGWCFLKSDFGALTLVPNAVAGRVVVGAPLTETLERQRQSELQAFLAPDYVDEARRLVGALETLFAPGFRSYSELLRGGAEARSADDPALAANLYGAALAIAPEDAKVWLEFGRATLLRQSADFNERNNIRARATSAAINSYLRSTSEASRAASLILLGSALELRQIWRPAIRAYRAALELMPDVAVADNLERLVAEHGFRILRHEVDTAAESPRICVIFSDPLPVSLPGLADFVTVEGAGLAVEPEGNQICIDGVEFGGRYRILVRAGLPALDGEVIQRAATLDVFVPDRRPWVGFSGNAYVLPAVAEPTIPIQTVNTGRVEAEIYRIGDRSLAFALREGIFLSQLEAYRASEIAFTYGELIWTGEVETADPRNELVTTAVPVTEALGQQQPGVYVITARIPDAETNYWEPAATQWFVISDIGLTTLTATDGLHTIVRSLTDAQPMEGVTVRLIARNNEVLGEAVTDAGGYARFQPGLIRGTAGASPQLIVAETGLGDYAFLDLTRPAFDLTDRGVEGRPSPAALDVYMRTERGVYRPGETVYATALVRDDTAMATADLPLTMIVERPDGVEHNRTLIEDEGLGGYLFTLALRTDAMRGSWLLRLYADPAGEPIAEEPFLVEDFVPERLDFEITAAAPAFELTGPNEFSVSARYLYGAVASGLTVTGDVAVTPVDSLAAYPGYRFGRGDDPLQRMVEPIDAAPETDEAGNAGLTVFLPGLPQTTRLLRGEVLLRMTDTSGRAVERSLTMPVALDGPRIGVRSRHDGFGVPEGGPAEFDVIAIDAVAARTAMEDVEWELVRLRTNYQWYSVNGVWRWEAITTSQRVASGMIDIEAGSPARISAPVDWGRYRLILTSSGDGFTSTTIDFSAGWYVANVGTDTPDVLAVALDKPTYRIGDTAELRLDPQFAGVALVAVIDNRLISMQMVEVPEEGTTVELAVTEEWGVGAYVKATLYRPIDVDAGRMPARSLGLTWAAVDPGDRDLAVAIDLPDEARPRGPLSIPVEIANLEPGTEAYVAVAAVDLGILNLTNYQPPAPDDWFFAQRRLGTAIRDLYGSLIDTMQGTLGAIRSGGDGGGARLGAPPPTEELVAFHSGIVRVDEEGRAIVSFDMPAFNGTVRVMVQAWSAAGVGHAVADVFVRDPVVVNASLPRFMHFGDSSRLLIEVDNVAGPAGDYRLIIDADAGIGVGSESRDRTLSLEAGGRASIPVPISAAAIGDFEIRLTMLTPDGEALPKDLQLGIRPPGLPETVRSFLDIPANGGTLTIDESAVSGLVRGTASVNISAGGAARLDVVGILDALHRYPYGCSEQTTSRALPLLYLNDVAASVGIGADEALSLRIGNAIASLLAKQTASGSFGMWGPYVGGDLWLDAYVTDFLTRAAAAGYDVPELALTIALDNLANSVSYASDFSAGGEAIAYALYVLAVNGRASIGDLRYYAEVKINDFGSSLAQAQIGAALALYGDRVRAERVFAAAVDRVTQAVDRPSGWRDDYGTSLRDLAAILALAAENAIIAVDTGALAERLADLRDQRRYTSTQEDAWTLMAAAALIAGAADTGLVVNGEALDGPLFAQFTDEELAAAPVEIVNTGNVAVEAAISVTGIPVTPPEAGGNGFTIERTYYLPDGTLADASTVAQNDRFVVTLTVTATEGRTAHLLVVDPLPAGFEIENPNLSQSGDIDRYPWLSTAFVDHSEARTDRFVAALYRYQSSPLQFTVAYTLRAVSPGVFAQPGAVVEDMYRPERRANTAAGTVEIVGPTQ